LKVLIIGGNSFIGKAIGQRLLKSSIPFEVTQRKHSGGLSDDFVINETTNVHEIQKFLFSNKITHIINCVALTTPGECQKNINLAFETNCQLFSRVLQSVVETDKKIEVLALSSSAVYGLGNEQKLEENSILCAHDIYGETKIYMERISQVYSKLSNLNIKIVRPFQIYGPGKSNDVVSDWIRKINNLSRSGKNEINLSKMDRVLDFLYIDDAADAIFKILLNSASPEITNLGSGLGTELFDLFHKLLELSEIEKTAVNINFEKSTETIVRVANIQRLRYFGWEPKVSLDKGLKLTFDYWKNREI
jgi:UDP-glucose 4-epimerase